MKKLNLLLLLTFSLNGFTEVRIGPTLQEVKIAYEKGAVDIDILERKRNVEDIDFEKDFGFVDGSCDPHSAKNWMKSEDHKKLLKLFYEYTDITRESMKDETFDFVCSYGDSIVIYDFDKGELERENTYSHNILGVNQIIEFGGKVLLIKSVKEQFKQTQSYSIVDIHLKNKYPTVLENAAANLEVFSEDFKYFRSGDLRLSVFGNKDNYGPDYTSYSFSKFDYNSNSLEGTCIINPHNVDVETLVIKR